MNGKKRTNDNQIIPSYKTSGNGIVNRVRGNFRSTRPRQEWREFFTNPTTKFWGTAYPRMLQFRACRQNFMATPQVRYNCQKNRLIGLSANFDRKIYFRRRRFPRVLTS